MNYIQKKKNQLEQKHCNMFNTFTFMLSQQTITCLSGNSNNSFCGDYTDDLYVYFEKRGSLSTSNVRFKFLVYVEKEGGDGKKTWTSPNKQS